MAERRSQRDVRLEYAFDRLLIAKLEQVYQILVPDRVRVVGDGGKPIGVGDEDQRQYTRGYPRTSRSRRTPSPAKRQR
jgi:hypothetical protein